MDFLPSTSPSGMHVEINVALAMSAPVTRHEKATQVTNPSGMCFSFAFVNFCPQSVPRAGFGLLSKFVRSGLQS